MSRPFSGGLLKRLVLCAEHSELWIFPLLVAFCGILSMFMLYHALPIHADIVRLLHMSHRVLMRTFLWIKTQIASCYGIANKLRVNMPAWAVEMRFKSIFCLNKIKDINLNLSLRRPTCLSKSWELYEVSWFSSSFSLLYKIDWLYNFVILH